MKLAAYARVSSDEQAERGTIENQIEYGEKYASLHHLGPIKWYMDDGVTGILPLDRRPVGIQLVTDAKAGLIELLLIYRLDRLGRNARIIINAIDKLEQCGVKVGSMTEPFDSATPTGRLLLTTLAGVADLDRNNILERMWHGANRAAKEGRWIGSVVPYGYRVDSNGYLEINNDPLPNFDLSEADIIRLIFMMVLENHDSTYKIANHLNALNIPTSYAIHNRQVKRGSNTSGIWRPDRIWNIITNPTYKGIHVYGKESKKERDLITREVPAIIAEHIWDHAQQLLKENRLKAVQDIKYRYFLRGLIRCGACGSTYSGTVYPGPGRENKGYYVCNGKTIYRGPHQKKCSSRNIDQMWIEDFIWGECLSFIESTGKAIEEFRVTVEKYRTSSAVFEKETKILTRSLQKLEAEKHHTLDYYRKGMLSLETITQSLRKIATEKDGYDLRLEEMSEPPPGQAWGLLTV